MDPSNSPNSDNPTGRYRNPRAPQPTRSGITSGMGRVLLGQKVIIYAILVHVIALVAYVVAHHKLFAICAVALALGLSLIGVMLIAKALGNSPGRTAFLAISMLIPLVNIAVLLLVNSQATSALRLAGYQVGLFGASK